MATVVLKSFKQQQARQQARQCLDNLFYQEEKIVVETQGEVAQRLDLEMLSSRLGRAGYLSAEEQRVLKTRAIIVIGCAVAFFAAMFAFNSGLKASVFALIVGVYLGAIGFVFFLRHREHETSREMLFQLPVALESLVLMVESGLGVLPALERIVNDPRAVTSKDPLRRILAAVYQRSADGIPFAVAAQEIGAKVNVRPLRHVLLHLDICHSEGGELIPALRRLSEYVHQEWKLSVEIRVRSLENKTVFPVFVSVIGLLLLLAAVPIISVLQFRESLQQRSSIEASAGGSFMAPVRTLGGK